MILYDNIFIIQANRLFLMYVQEEIFKTELLNYWEI